MAEYSPYFHITIYILTHLDWLIPSRSKCLDILLILCLFERSLYELIFHRPLIYDYIIQDDVNPNIL